MRWCVTLVNFVLIFALVLPKPLMAFEEYSSESESSSSQSSWSDSTYTNESSSSSYAYESSSSESSWSESSQSSEESSSSDSSSSDSSWSESSQSSEESSSSYSVQSSSSDSSSSDSSWSESSQSSEESSSSDSSWSESSQSSEESSSSDSSSSDSSSSSSDPCPPEKVAELEATEAGKCCGVDKDKCEVKPHEEKNWRLTGYYSDDNGGLGCYADNPLTGMGTGLKKGSPVSVAVPPDMKNQFKGAKVCIPDLDDHYNGGEPIEFKVDDITAVPKKRFGGERRVDVCFDKSDRPVSPTKGREKDPRFDEFLNNSNGHSVIMCK